jgi:phage protein D
VWADDGSFDYQTLEGGQSTGAPVKVHFQEARSLTNPGRDFLVLQWGGGDQATVVNVTDFNARLQVADQYATVTAGGSNGHGQRVTALADVSEIKKDLHPDSALDASVVRSRFFAAPGEKPSSLNVDVSNLDQARAKRKAAAELRKKARELCTVEGTAVGNLKLRAGIHVRVNGMSAPFDGIYYVTRAVHSLDGGGYKTQFSLRRPGLSDPDLYPGTVPQ